MLRNAKVRKVSASKYECPTCHKKFKEIANFLLHRALHENPAENQNGAANNRVLHPTQRKNSKFKDSLDIGDVFSLELSEDDDELRSDDPQSKQHDGNQEIPGDAACPTTNKSTQPTGAKKRKGGLQVQCKSKDLHS